MPTTYIFNVLVAPLLPHQFTGFPASLKRDLLNVRCLLLTNFRLFLSRTFVLCRLLNYDLTPTKKAQELAFVVEHNIEGALGVFFIDAMGKIGCQVSKREVQNPSTFFSSTNGPFNLQPLFQKTVEKWFQRSDSRNVVQEMWFKTNSSSDLDFFSGSRKGVDQKKGGFIL